MSYASMLLHLGLLYPSFPFFLLPTVIRSHPSSSCSQRARHRRRGSSPTTFSSFLLLSGPSPFHLLRGRFSSFCVGLSEISLSRVALPDRSSQANPALLGFSSSGSVRESVLLCALSGQTQSVLQRQTTSQTVSYRDLSPSTLRGPLQQQERRRAIGWRGSMMRQLIVRLRSDAKRRPIRAYGAKPQALGLRLTSV
jgi:hypothetical protein